jgi:BA14K-like protein
MARSHHHFTMICSINTVGRFGERVLSTHILLNELARRGCIVLLAAAALLSSPSAWSQSSGDGWQPEATPAVSRLRDCVGAFAGLDAGRGQDENWSALLLAAIEGDCRAEFDAMIQLLAQHVAAKDIELRLRAITETTLLPALKEARSGEQSTAGGSAIPALPTESAPPKPEPVLTDSIAVPDSAGGRRALQSQARVRHGLPPKFSPEWLDHCRAKYTSFNPKTGMYRSFGGVSRPCR